MEDQTDQDEFLRTLGIVKWKGEKPAWLSVTSIDRKHKNLQELSDTGDLHKEIQDLILEKGELAAHLEKAQQLLETK